MKLFGQIEPCRPVLAWGTCEHHGEPCHEERRAEVPPGARIRAAVCAQAKQLLLEVSIDLRRKMPVRRQSGGRLSLEVEARSNRNCQCLERREVAAGAIAQARQRLFAHAGASGPGGVSKAQAARIGLQHGQQR